MDFWVIGICGLIWTYVIRPMVDLLGGPVIVFFAFLSGVALLIIWAQFSGGEQEDPLERNQAAGDSLVNDSGGQHGDMIPILLANLLTNGDVLFYSLIASVSQDLDEE